MKKLITIALLGLGLSASGQNKTTDSLVKACKERGHIFEPSYTSTNLYCPPYKKDYPDSTVIVYPNCNAPKKRDCTRCKKEITMDNRPTEVTIWRRKSL